jgi:hypothetical protein
VSVEGKTYAAPRRLWPVALVVVVVVVVMALLVWAFWPVPVPPGQRCTNSKFPPCSYFVLGDAVNNSTPTQSSYWFPVEVATTNLSLTELSFSAREINDTAFSGLSSVCVAGPSGVPLGTWAGGWAPSGDSLSCTASAIHAAGNNTITVDDSVYIYLDPGVSAETDVTLVVTLSAPYNYTSTQTF